MSYLVRPLGPEDQPAWRALRLEALETHPAAFLTTAAEQRARSAENDRAALAHGLFRGLFHGADLVGMAALIPMRAAAARHRMEVGAVYLQPAHQGGGAAAVLMQALIDEARDHGALQLELSVEIENTRAIRFYEKLGFERFGLQPRAAIQNGVAHDDAFYVLMLDR